MLDFDTFLESLDHVPPEFERNFNLIKDLDSRSNELIGHINDLLKKYKETRKARDRRDIKAEIDSSMEKMTSYAHDKIELASQTYELIDKNIKSLLVLIQPAESGDSTAPQVPPGYEMPISDYEPRYCVCRAVSFGEMIACENPECPIEWFHLPCVQLLKAPKASWYCQDCVAKKGPVKPPTTPSRKTPKRKR